VAVEHRNRTDRNVTVVTDAQRSRTEELRERQRRYLWAMGARTVFVALAVVLAVYVNLALGIALGIISLPLPVLAVIFANAGPRRGARRQQRYIPPAGNELGSQDPHRRR
jgi:hypothetical protein